MVKNRALIETNAMSHKAGNSMPQDGRKILAVHGADARAGGFSASLSPRSMWWQDNSLAVLMPGHPQNLQNQNRLQPVMRPKMDMSLGLSEYFCQWVNFIANTACGNAICSAGSAQSTGNGGGGGWDGPLSSMLSRGSPSRQRRGSLDPSSEKAKVCTLFEGLVCDLEDSQSLQGPMKYIAKSRVSTCGADLLCRSSTSTHSLHCTATCARCLTLSSAETDKTHDPQYIAIGLATRLLSKPWFSP